MRYLPAIEILIMGCSGYPTSNRVIVRRMFAQLLLRFAIALGFCFTLAQRLPAQITTLPNSPDSFGASLVNPSLLPPGPDSIRGTVLNRVTREPIARALVYTPDNRYAVLTGDRGDFEFKFPPRDKPPPPTPSSVEDTESVRALQLWYARNTRPDVFVARKPGFLSDQNQVRVPTISGTQAELVLMLEPEAHIVGHVVLPEADSTNRIQLQLFRQGFNEGRERWTQMEGCTTWANGEFRFAELPSGTYKLLTLEQMEADPATFNPGNQLYGYPPVFFPNTKEFATATPIHLAAGTTFEANISVSLHEYYPVKIAVSNPPADGFPSVEVFPQGPPSPGYALGYDTGEEQIRGFLPNGAYTLKLATYPSQQGSSGVMNFNVRGGPVEGKTISMFPNFSLFVSVKTEFELRPSADIGFAQGGDTGNPLANSRVSVALTPAELFGMEAGANSQPVTGGSGDALVMNNVFPGSYWLHFNTADAYVASAVWGGTDVLHHALTVGTAGVSSPIEIALRNDGAEVSGSVQSLQNTNSPDPSTHVTAPAIAFVYFLPLSDSEGQFHQTQAGEDGAFTERQIPPGTYRILAFDRMNAQLGSTIQEARRKYDSSGVVVTLAPNQKEKLPSPVILVSEP
jgi:hypothetical protein